MDAKHFISTLVSNLLYTEAAQDKLVELIWAEFTAEEKRAIADEAHRAATEKVGKIVESRLFAIGGERRVNLFSRHVTKVVEATFATEKVADTIKAVVQEHLDEAISGVKAQAKGLVAKLFRETISAAFQRIDLYGLRDSMSAALAKETE